MCEIFSFCEIKKFVEFQIKLINNEKQNVIRKFQGNTKFAGKIGLVY